MAGDRPEEKANKVAKDLNQHGLTSDVMGEIQTFYKEHKGNQAAINSFNRELSKDIKDVFGDVQVYGSIDDGHGNKTGLAIKKAGGKETEQIRVRTTADEAGRKDTTEWNHAYKTADRITTGTIRKPGEPIFLSRKAQDEIKTELQNAQPNERQTFLQRVNETFAGHGQTLKGLDAQGNLEWEKRPMTGHDHPAKGQTMIVEGEQSVQTHGQDRAHRSGHGTEHAGEDRAHRSGHGTEHAGEDRAHRSGHANERAGEDRLHVAPTGDKQPVDQAKKLVPTEVPAQTQPAEKAQKPEQAGVKPPPGDSPAQTQPQPEQKSEPSTTRRNPYGSPPEMKPQA